MEFERLGVFKYSREEGTPAYRYKNQISEKEKGSRFNQLMSAQQDVSRRIGERLKGRTLKVIIEEKGRGFYTARTEYDAPDIDGLVYVYPVREKFSNGVKGNNLKIVKLIIFSQIK